MTNDLLPTADLASDPLVCLGCGATDPRQPSLRAHVWADDDLCVPCYLRSEALGRAWLITAAATPAGWVWHGVDPVDHSTEFTDPTPTTTWGPDWRASMSWPDHCHIDDCDHDEAFAVGIGDTPTTAMEALVVELRNRQLVPA